MSKPLDDLLAADEDDAAQVDSGGPAARAARVAA